MIDWLTYRVRVAHHDPLANGAVMKVDPSGAVEWSSTVRMEMAGSYSTSVYVRSLDSRTVEISGNPNKFLQGHNLWGSNDVVALGLYLAARMGDTFGFCVQGLEELSRVDIAGLIDLGLPATVQEMVRALGNAGTMRNRGRGNNTDEGTVYWGKRSRRWALKIYDKQREVLSTKSVQDVEKVASVAAGKLRVELVLRGLELKSLGLKQFDQWSTISPMVLLKDFLERLELADQSPRLQMGDLPRHLKLPFMQWAQGDDLRTLYPKRTFYRYRKLLLGWNIDIAVPPAEPMTHISELTDNRLGYGHLPDLRKLEFWEPSETDKTLLAFEPSDVAAGRVVA